MWLNKSSIVSEYFFKKSDEDLASNNIIIFPNTKV